MTKKEQQRLIDIIAKLRNYISDVQLHGVPLDDLRRINDEIEELIIPIAKWKEIKND